MAVKTESCRKLDRPAKKHQDRLPSPEIRSWNPCAEEKTAEQALQRCRMYQNTHLYNETCPDVDMARTQNVNAACFTADLPRKTAKNSRRLLKSTSMTTFRSIGVMFVVLTAAWNI